MENNKTFIWVAIALLGAVCLCGICLVMAASTLAIGTHLPLPPGLSPAKDTATPALSPRPSATITVTPKPPESLTATPVLTSTLTLTTTEAGLFTPALTITATLPFTEGLAALGTETLLPTETATVGPVVVDRWCIPWNAPSDYGRVIDIIDGVTILVEIDGQTAEVRYIGIDLVSDAAADPAAWINATEKNRQLVQGKTVLLLKDRSETNDAGQLLRYVIVDTIFVNREMVSSGYATASSTPPDITCDTTFLEAEMAAIASQRGLWAPTPTITRTLIPLPTPTVATTGNIIIVRVSFKGNGWADPEEFVEIQNDSSWPIQVEGWTLSDNKNHVYTFTPFIMKPGDFCRVYTNEYHPTSCGFSYFSASAIWDDTGDCAYLKDALGSLVAEYCYE